MIYFLIQSPANFHKAMAACEFPKVLWKSCKKANAVFSAGFNPHHCVSCISPNMTNKVEKKKKHKYAASP